jgi:RimJ/RimL family protein N-acetyltransferase
MGDGERVRSDMIEGRLVNLRAHALGDARRYHAWFNDGEVCRYLMGHRYGQSLPAEEEWVRRRVSAPIAYDSPGFAVETKDGVHIGSVGFYGVKPEDRLAEIGIVLGDKRYWDSGYGTDTMLTLMRFGFEEMNLARIDLTVDEENERARACYRRCGFIEEVRLRQYRYGGGTYRGVLVMGILREEFEARERGGVT